MTIAQVPATVPAIPGSAWAFAGMCLAGEVVLLLERGFSDSDTPLVLLSAAVSAFVVRWFADGVMKARGGRVTVVGILLVVGLLLEFFAVGDSREVSGLTWLGLLLSAGQVAAFFRYCRSGYYRAQQLWHGALPVVLREILLAAVITGALGGATAPPGASHNEQSFHVGL